MTGRLPAGVAAVSGRRAEQLFAEHPVEILRRPESGLEGELLERHVGVRQQKTGAVEPDSAAERRIRGPPSARPRSAVRAEAPRSRRGQRAPPGGRLPASQTSAEAKRAPPPGSGSRANGSPAESRSPPAASRRERRGWRPPPPFRRRCRGCRCRRSASTPRRKRGGPGRGSGGGRAPGSQSPAHRSCAGGESSHAPPPAGEIPPPARTSPAVRFSETPRPCAASLLGLHCVSCHSSTNTTKAERLQVRAEGPRLIFRGCGVY